ncbi:secretin N-terminal domain-containing protein [Victivallis sp. Marseille-Q1083]|uniref:secretin N-terminal domain-containing protein n=1 Tax=Victivallis sp. Marseille-Q1083 TaxID=2717288 RepID=UPI00158F0DAB|nr:secretin N-terminal domain-containing protein [Victivallis sp. Marseille-Q1083]
MLDNCLKYCRMAACCLILAGCVSSETEPASEEASAQTSEEQRNQWFETMKGKPDEPRENLVQEMLPMPEMVTRDNPHIVAGDPIYPPVLRLPPELENKTLPPVPQLEFDDPTPVEAEFNFNAAALADVVPVFAELLELNYLLDPAVTGTVTINLNQPLSRKELWQIFNQILNLSGAFAEYDGQLVKIRPAAALGQVATTASGAPVELGIFRLKNIPVKDLAAQIKPFLSKEVTPLELEKSNLLLVPDSREVLAKVRVLIAELDQPVRKEWCKMVLPCRRVAASRLVAELSEILPVLGFPVVTDKENPAPEAIQLISLDRLQIIVAAAASQDALLELGTWMNILDQTEVGEQERLFIYNIQNGEAGELVKALSVMFPVEGTTMTMESAGKDTAAAAASTETISSESEAKSTDKKIDGPGSVFEVPVKVFGDAIHNRLLIRTTPRTYAMLKALLDRLDTIPAQVLLQVLVIEVNLNDSVKFGVEFMMQGGNGSVENLGGTNFKNLAPGTGQDSQYGAKYWIFNPDNPDEKYGYINALAGQTNVKVISSPQVLILSHNEAEISVGNKVPIVNSEITNTQSVVPNPDDASTNLVRNIQYQDTGIILKIMPKVTRGGRITIKMDQTVSEAQENKTSKIDSPEIQERVLKTVMNIKDGQTIICGGIIREKTTDNLDTVPIIGSIPFLRRLVGDTDVSTQRTEMLILISGHIVSAETKLDDLLKRYKESVDRLVEFEQAADSGNAAKAAKHSGNVDQWFFE